MFMNLFRNVSLAFTCCLCICKADNNLETRHFFESCYGASHDSKTEMTDIILVNARFTDQDQIHKLADEVVNRYKQITNSTEWFGWLDEIFTSSSMSNNANIQLFRERKVDDYYRLDILPGLQTFSQLGWNGGQFTNEYSFLLGKISVPPRGTNRLWSLYDIQPNASRLSVEAGEHKLIPDTDFYERLYGLPSLLLGNIILQTADLAALKAAAKKHDYANEDPGDFSWFNLDEHRLADALGPNGNFKNWGVRPISGDFNGIKQLSVIQPNGFDRDGVRVIFNEANPKQRYLAYMRDNDGNIAALYAWDYDEKGSPIRFLRVERQGDGKFAGWAQNIIYLGKVGNVDWSIFQIDVAKYSSIYDERGKYPIQTVNGKVVFDASKDKYSSPNSPSGNADNSLSAWADNNVKLIRAIMLTACFVPPVIVLCLNLKKWFSKSK